MENWAWKLEISVLRPKKSEYVGSFGHGSKKLVFYAQERVNMWEVLGMEVGN